jgi:hypothetical protein
MSTLILALELYWVYGKNEWIDVWVIHPKDYYIDRTIIGVAFTLKGLLVSDIIKEWITHFCRKPNIIPKPTMMWQVDGWHKDLF